MTVPKSIRPAATLTVSENRRDRADFDDLATLRSEELRLISAGGCQRLGSARLTRSQRRRSLAVTVGFDFREDVPDAHVTAVRLESQAHSADLYECSRKYRRALILQR